jgi:hypothetical protein
MRRGYGPLAAMATQWIAVPGGDPTPSPPTHGLGRCLGDALAQLYCSTDRATLLSRRSADNQARNSPQSNHRTDTEHLCFACKLCLPSGLLVFGKVGSKSAEHDVVHPHDDACAGCGLDDGNGDLNPLRNAKGGFAPSRCEVEHPHARPKLCRSSILSLTGPVSRDSMSSCFLQASSTARV